jgi:hypothetical protein
VNVTREPRLRTHETQLLLAANPLTSSVACSSSRGQRAEGELRGFLYTRPSSSTSSEALISSSESRGAVRWDRLLSPAGNLPLRHSATIHCSYCWVTDLHRCERGKLLPRFLTGRNVSSYPVILSQTTIRCWDQIN